MNVSFINTFYFPDEEERERLEDLQDELTIIHAELEYSLRDLSGWNKWLQKESFRNKFRRRKMRIVDNKEQAS